jgi:hypothetical protein
MAGQPTAEPSHSAPKRTSFFPSLRFVLSGAEDIRLSRRLAGRPEAARVASNRRMMTHHDSEVDGSAILAS